jgi:hypothetical protein
MLEIFVDATDEKFEPGSRLSARSQRHPAHHEPGIPTAGVGDILMIGQQRRFNLRSLPADLWRIVPEKRSLILEDHPPNQRPIEKPVIVRLEPEACVRLGHRHFHAVQ